MRLAKAIPIILCGAALWIAPQRVIAQVPEPKPQIQLDGDFTYQFTWFSDDFRASLGLWRGRSRVSAQFGWGLAGYPGRVYALGYQFRWIKPQKSPSWFEPYIAALLYANPRQRTSILRNHGNKLYGLDLAAGLRLNLPYGTYLFVHAGFGFERIIVPDFESYFEHRTWMKPSSGIGFGYRLGIRPWQGIKQRPAPLPPAPDSIPRHAVHLQVSRARFAFFQPSNDIRIQYAYAIRPRIHAYAGLDFFTTRWITPDFPGPDTFGLGTFRLGGRFFPIGTHRRLSPYAETSGAIGYRFARAYIFAGETPHAITFDWGMGIRARPRRTISADLFFFRRGFRLIAPLRAPQREYGFSIGLGYHFGKSGPRH